MEVRPISTQPHQSIAATAHFLEAERLLAALPLVDKRQRDHHLHLALVNAVLAIAAGFTTNAEGVERNVCRLDAYEQRPAAMLRGVSHRPDV
jgi:hypothetical protein